MRASPSVMPNGQRVPRTWPTSRFRPDHESLSSPMADAAAKDGLSQLEQGRVTLLDSRTTIAMRIAMESTLRDIASRFALKAQVVQAVANDGSARFVVVLAVNKP